MLLKQFLFATVTLGLVVYLVKGRDRGAPLWHVLIGAAVFSAAALALRTIDERRNRR